METHTQHTEMSRNTGELKFTLNLHWNCALLLTSKYPPMSACSMSHMFVKCHKCLFHVTNVQIQTQKMWLKNSCILPLPPSECHWNCACSSPSLLCLLKFLFVRCQKFAGSNSNVKIYWQHICLVSSPHLFSSLLQCWGGITFAT